MSTRNVMTVSDRPAALARAQTTTRARSRPRVLGGRALGLACAALWWLWLAGVAEPTDLAGRAAEARSGAEPAVTRFVITGAAVAEDVDEAIALAVLRENRRPGSPLALGGMTDRVERTLRDAFPVAVQRVREVDSCRDLFTQLGADGVETLTSTVYRPARSERDRGICEAADAAAFTVVDRSHTRLCARFGGRPRQTAAMILIHEALHSAGMTEQPHDPDALSSFQINRLVRRSCDL
jgi:hypothetical protein